MTALLCWREGVTVEAIGEDALRVQSQASRVVLRRLAPVVVSALGQLQPPGSEEESLARFVQDGGGALALAAWYYWLRELARRCLLCRTVQLDGRKLATLLPIASGFVLAPAVVDPGRSHVLSRFAYLRREGNTFLLESPLAHARVICWDGRFLELLWALGQPGTAKDLAGRIGMLPLEAVVSLLGLLASAGMLQPEDESPALRCWEFHDLLFHARSRQGRCDALFGATYRMAGQVDPPSAIKPSLPGAIHPLFRPDAHHLQRDPPFAEILERRSSLRQYGASPISDRQLGEFLYRVARVKDSREFEIQTPAGPMPMTFTSRPYPAGGALYELEFYLAVAACDGLAAGLYHYDPQQHHLVQVCGATAEVEQLLADAGASAGISRENLQVLVVLAARFGRLAWKYESIAYALMLKHVGVVQQTMYLVATAMNLAPCALGGGDADLFSRVAGTDYYTETSVGEFLLGSSDLHAAVQEKKAPTTGRGFA